MYDIILSVFNLFFKKDIPKMSRKTIYFCKYFGCGDTF